MNINIKLINNIDLTKKKSPCRITRVLTCVVEPAFSTIQLHNDSKHGNTWLVSNQSEGVRFGRVRLIVSFRVGIFSRVCTFITFNFATRSACERRS